MPPGLLRNLQFGPHLSCFPRMFRAGCAGRPGWGAGFAPAPAGWGPCVHSQIQGTQCLLLSWAPAFPQSFHGSLPYKAVHGHPPDPLARRSRPHSLPAHWPPNPPHFGPPFSQQDSFYLGGFKAFNLWPYACNSTQSTNCPEM